MARNPKPEAVKTADQATAAAAVDQKSAAQADQATTSATAGVTPAPAPAGDGTEGAAAVQQTSPPVAAAAPPGPEVPLSFVGPEDQGETILITSAVQIDGIDVRHGLVTVSPSIADQLVRAGAASRPPA